MSRALLDILDGLKVKIGAGHRRGKSMRQAVGSALKSRKNEGKR